MKKKNTSKSTHAGLPDSSAWSAIGSVSDTKMPSPASRTLPGYKPLSNGWLSSANESLLHASRTQSTSWGHISSQRACIRSRTLGQGPRSAKFFLRLWLFVAHTSFLRRASSPAVRIWSLHWGFHLQDHMALQHWYSVTGWVLQQSVIYYGLKNSRVTF